MGKRGRLAALCVLVALWVPSAAHALFSFSGVQTNLPVSALNGWQLCYLDTYANSGTPVSNILSQCNGAQLLMACRPTGSPILTLAANAPRADVIFDTGTGNTTHPANGVEWYFNDSFSWGFAPAGDSVDRDSCDFNFGSQIDANLRLCWHTEGGAIHTGFRCGDNDLNGDPTFERLLFQPARSTPAPALSWSSLLALVVVLLGIGVYRTTRRAGQRHQAA